VGEKSRWGWVVERCFMSDCVNWETDVCKTCIKRFDYKPRGKAETTNDTMREVHEQDLPKDKETLRSS